MLFTCSVKFLLGNFKCVSLDWTFPLLIQLPVVFSSDVALLVFEHNLSRHIYGTWKQIRINWALMTANNTNDTKNDTVVIYFLCSEDKSQPCKCNRCMPPLTQRFPSQCVLQMACGTRTRQPLAQSLGRCRSSVLATTAITLPSICTMPKCDRTGRIIMTQTDSCLNGWWGVGFQRGGGRGCVEIKTSVW